MVVYTWWCSCSSLPRMQGQQQRPLTPRPAPPVPQDASAPARPPAPQRVDPNINISVTRQIYYGRLNKLYRQAQLEGFRQKPVAKARSTCRLHLQTCSPDLLRLFEIRVPGRAPTIAAASAECAHPCACVAGLPTGYPRPRGIPTVRAWLHHRSSQLPALCMLRCVSFPHRLSNRVLPLQAAGGAGAA